MKRKFFFVLIPITLSVVLGTGISRVSATTEEPQIDAFSGATPLALNKDVPNNLSLTIDGRVKQTYRFDSRSLRLLAHTRIRIPEVTPRGNIMGTYIYTGVPVLHILEGVVPQKKKTDAFDRPLDMIVTATSADGTSVHFSYGELTMANDSLPVMLAFSREPLNPSKDPDKYTKNRLPKEFNGLRLVCPAEKDNSRFLDNVVRITLVQPAAPDHLLPKMQRKKDCSSSAITCISEEKQWAANFKNIPAIQNSYWVRIGHGRGIKGDTPATVSGPGLVDFLKQNFPKTSEEDFFMFVACDGYRSLFSGKEIFGTEAGTKAMLIDQFNGKPHPNGYTLGPCADFFIDRSIRAVTHIVRLRFR